MGTNFVIVEEFFLAGYYFLRFCEAAFNWKYNIFTFLKLSETTWREVRHSYWDTRHSNINNGLVSEQKRHFKWNVLIVD